MISTLPSGRLFQTNCSTLLTRSNLRDVAVMFPCRSRPLAARTIRSRSFCSASPGGSDHTSVIFRSVPALVTGTVNFSSSPPSRMTDRDTALGLLRHGKCRGCHFFLFDRVSGRAKGSNDHSPRQKTRPFLRYQPQSFLEGPRSWDAIFGSSYLTI